jgi:hypothetical protein
LEVAQKSAPPADGAPVALSPAFTAGVDRARSTIRVRGHLDRVGAELVGGMVEELHRDGHRHVVVALVPPATADDGAGEVLGDLTRRLAADGGRLTVR